MQERVRATILAQPAEHIRIQIRFYFPFFVCRFACVFIARMLNIVPSVCIVVCDIAIKKIHTADSGFCPIFVVNAVLVFGPDFTAVSSPTVFRFTRIGNGRELLLYNSICYFYIFFSLSFASTTHFVPALVRCTFLRVDMVTREKKSNKNKRKTANNP